MSASSNGLRVEKIVCISRFQCAKIMCAEGYAPQFPGLVRFIRVRLRVVTHRVHLIEARGCPGRDPTPLSFVGIVGNRRENVACLPSIGSNYISYSSSLLALAKSPRSLELLVRSCANACASVLVTVS
jgi:hypothetical protein